MRKSPEYFSPTVVSASCIPPEETGYTLHDRQLSEAIQSADREERLRLERDIRIALLEDELTRRGLLPTHP